jgi:transcriptional regulator with XRE-family HTH domain
MVLLAGEATPNFVLLGLRESRGWTQEETAEKLNELCEQETGKRDSVTAGTISRYERGVVRPSAGRRRRLATLFGVELGDLGYDLARSAIQPIAGRGEGGLVQTFPMSLDTGVREQDERVAASQDEWRLIRRGLNQHRVALAQIAARCHSDCQRVAGTSLLTHGDWLPTEPLDMFAIELDWMDEPSQPQVHGTEPQTSHVRPPLAPGRRYSHYTHAIRDLERPSLFENRGSYRLLGVDWTNGGSGRLSFGSTTYFAPLDVCEAVAHELASAHLAVTPTGLALHPTTGRRLPFRRLLGDPFDLTRRPLLPSIDTLTIRRSRDGARFVLHQRDADQVAIAGGMYHIMPAGVFQPSGVTPQAHQADFSLWHNMLREYSEEFLGNFEHETSVTEPIDYEGAEPFRSLNQARREGKLRTWCFGIGLDPLTLWGEILTAVVIDDDVFDQVFGGMVAINDEGTVVRSMPGGKPSRGVPFVEDVVERLLTYEPAAPAAAGCIALAWQHRDQLLAG